MKVILATIMAAIAVFVLSTAAFAQDKPGGFRGEVLGEIEGLEREYLGLAEAIPDDKYGWRPGEGVRSVSEVFMHVAGANYLLPGFIGVNVPEGLSKDMKKITADREDKGTYAIFESLPTDMDKVTAKAEVIIQLRDSFAHLKNAVMGMSEVENYDDLEGELRSGRGNPTLVFGYIMSHHQFGMFMTTHLREHLRKLIEYSK